MEDSLFALPNMHPFGTAMFNESNLQFNRPDHALFCTNELPSVGKHGEDMASPSHGSTKVFSSCINPSSMESNLSSGVNQQACVSESGTPIGNDDDLATVCKDCGKKFSERSLLLRHRVVHAEAKYVCDFCHRAFVRDDKLKRHIRCVHSHERPFVCEVCAKAFARKDKLQEHARHHNRDITFPCPVCPEVFVMRSHLNRHLRTVHNLKFTPATSVTSSCSSSASTTASTAITQIGANQNNKSNTIGVSAFVQAPTDHAQQQTPTTQFTLSGTEMVLTPISTNPSDKRSRRKSTTATKRSKLGLTVGEHDHQDVPKSSTITTETLSPRFSNPNPYTSAFSAPMLSNSNQVHNNNNNGSMNFSTNFLFGQPNVYQTIQQQQQQQQPQVSFTSDTRLSYPNGLETSLTAAHQQQHALSRYDNTQSGTGPQTQSALSAAMAASLLAPVNYVGWWHQSNPSLMLPYAQSNQFVPRVDTKHGCASLATTDSGTYGQLSTGLTNAVDQVSTRAQPSVQLDSSALGSTSQSWLAAGSGHPSRPAQMKPDPAYYSSAMSYPTSAHMLASLNPFAQAMYYQAATLAATQNGQPTCISSSDPHVSQSTDVPGDIGGRVTGSPFFS